MVNYCHVVKKAYLFKFLKLLRNMGIIERLNMRLLGGEVTAEKFARFNAMRHTMISRNPDYEQFLGSKSKAVRMFVNIFIEYPTTIMELAEKVNEDE